MMGEKAILVKPMPPIPLQIGALYEFREMTLTGDLVVDGKRWRGWVRKEYRRFYLVEDVLGFFTTIHKYSVGNDWQVKRI